MSWWMDTTLILLKTLFAVGILAVLGWVVVRPLFLVWRQHPDPEAMMPRLQELPEEELQIPSEPGAKPDRNALIAQARSDPRRTAMIMQQWIRDKGERRGRKPGP
jgi:hypothetical protein